MAGSKPPLVGVYTQPTIDYSIRPDLLSIFSV